jgi:hypothetical protein
MPIYIKGLHPVNNMRTIFRLLGWVILKAFGGILWFLCGPKKQVALQNRARRSAKRLLDKICCI